MKEFILDNGMKLIYENRPSMLTSVSIGLEAGASVEDWLLGLAHGLCRPSGAANVAISAAGRGAAGD